MLGALDQAEDIREVFEDVVWRHRGKKIAPKTVNQKRYVDAIRDHTVTFAIGPAGTGKTYLAMALAVARARRSGRSAGSSSPGRRSRPASGSASCPATCSRRSTRTCARSTTRSTTCSTPTGSTPYMEKGAIEVAPLAFMRGRTLNDSFIILDEAQNTSPEQMQMFLTRLGFGSKVVVTGDVTQIDLPREQASGPDPGAGHPRRRSTGIAFVRFGHEDVVRHKLVQRIVEAYRAHAEETGTQRGR